LQPGFVNQYKAKLNFRKYALTRSFLHRPFLYDNFPNGIFLRETFRQRPLPAYSCAHPVDGVDSQVKIHK
jgi:hypothetical protein